MTRTDMNTLNLSAYEIARLIDISAVRADSTYQDVQDIIAGALKHQFICVFPLPGLLPVVFEKLKGHPEIGIGGVVGFPSGGETTSSKLAQAQELKDAGCNEIDMVLNIGKLKSGMLADVEDEIRQIKAVVSPLPLKVIMEVVLLTDDEIRTASSIILKAGADYIKTGTGWAGTTTLDHIRLIKETVGDAIKLKVAGGVRTLDTLQEMYRMGVTRFGIGYKAALNIMEESINRETQ